MARAVAITDVVASEGGRRDSGLMAARYGIRSTPGKAVIRPRRGDPLAPRALTGGKPSVGAAARQTQRRRESGQSCRLERSMSGREIYCDTSCRNPGRPITGSITRTLDSWSIRKPVALFPNQCPRSPSRHDAQHFPPKTLLCRATHL